MIMNLSVLVLDDDQEQAMVLTNFLEEIPYITNIFTCQNAEEALTYLSSEQVDFVFLDMEMPGLSGMDLLSSFFFPPTIIVSSHPSFAIDSYDNNSVIDFIEKPVTFLRLMRALNRVSKHINKDSNNETLYLKVGRKMQNFKIDTIQYVEADGIYCKVWLNNNSFVHVNDNISEIEQKLLHTKIIRLHKSYIFNLSYLKAFDSRNIWIGEQQFSVGAKYRSKLNNILNVNASSQ